VRQQGGLRRHMAAWIMCACAGFALAGCSQMSNPTYDLGDLGCASSSIATIKAIQAKVTADGTLRNGKQVRADDGQVFVSAELHLRSDDPHDKGDILTWVTDDVESNEFFSVDVNARDESSWPDAKVDVTAQGARESRACVGPSLGKTPAQIQCEIEQSSGDVPGDRNCEDL